nr:hypothetical protein [Candidatus Sigynarchaeota archaeon]
MPRQPSTRYIYKCENCGKLQYNEAYKRSCNFCGKLLCKKCQKHGVCPSDYETLRRSEKTGLSVAANLQVPYCAFIWLVISGLLGVYTDHGQHIIPIPLLLASILLAFGFSAILWGIGKAVEKMLKSRILARIKKDAHDTTASYEAPSTMLKALDEASYVVMCCSHCGLKWESKPGEVPKFCPTCGKGLENES